MTAVLTGLRAWVVQRVTGAYLAAYILYLVLALALDPPAGYADWQAWMTAPAMVVATGLAFLALFYHAWVGIRDVVLDYVHPTLVRGLVLILVMAALLAQGIWVVLILAGVAV